MFKFVQPDKQLFEQKILGNFKWIILLENVRKPWRDILVTTYNLFVIA